MALRSLNFWWSSPSSPSWRPLLLPALAAAKRKAKLSQCTSNFHQVIMGSNIYANDYNDYYPIDNTHPATINKLNGPHYVRYFGAQAANTAWHQGIQVDPASHADVFNNLGHLYELMEWVMPRRFIVQFPEHLGVES